MVGIVQYPDIRYGFTYIGKNSCRFKNIWPLFGKLSGQYGYGTVQVTVMR